MEILKDRKLYFDTNIVVYILEGAGEKKSILHKKFVGLLENGNQIITGELTLAECLVKPKKDKKVESERIYLKFLTKNKNIGLKKVDKDTWLLSSDIRAKYGFLLPDSIHIAIAILNNCIFMTNDKKLKNIEELEIIYLEDFLN